MKAKVENIVGQGKLVREVSKVLRIFNASEAMIRPHFILTGPSGSGKSFTIKTLVEELGLTYLEINAAQLTKEGVSGNSVSKSLSPLRNISSKPAVVFVDEFDKLFISGNSNSDLAHESSHGVQNEFLKILESETTSVFGDYGKYVEVPSSNLLFVFAGAFNGEEDVTIDKLRHFGLKTEFLGRVSLVYNALPLEVDHLYRILDESTLLNIYLRLFKDVEREEVINCIRHHIKENHEYNTLGARYVNTLIHQYFITGGLKEEEVKKVSFQNTLQLEEIIL